MQTCKPWTKVLGWHCQHTQAIQGDDCGCTANTRQRCKEAALIVVPTNVSHVPGNWDGTADTWKQRKEATLMIAPDAGKEKVIATALTTHTSNARGL